MTVINRSLAPELNSTSGTAELARAEYSTSPSHLGEYVELLDELAQEPIPLPAISLEIPQVTWESVAPDERPTYFQLLVMGNSEKLDDAAELVQILDSELEDIRQLPAASSEQHKRLLQIIGAARQELPAILREILPVSALDEPACAAWYAHASEALELSCTDSKVVFDEAQAANTPPEQLLLDLTGKFVAYYKNEFDPKFNELSSSINSPIMNALRATQANLIKEHQGVKRRIRKGEAGNMLVVRNMDPKQMEQLREKLHESMLRQLAILSDDELSKKYQEVRAKQIDSVRVYELISNDPLSIEKSLAETNDKQELLAAQLEKLQANVRGALTGAMIDTVQAAVENIGQSLPEKLNKYLLAKQNKEARRPTSNDIQAFADYIVSSGTDNLEVWLSTHADMQEQTQRLRAMNQDSKLFPKELQTQLARAQAITEAFEVLTTEAGKIWESTLKKEGAATQPSPTEREAVIQGFNRLFSQIFKGFAYIESPHGVIDITSKTLEINKNS